MEPPVEPNNSENIKFHNADRWSRGESLSETDWKKCDDEANGEEIHLETLRKCCKIFKTKRLLKIFKAVGPMEDMVFDMSYFRSLEPKEQIRILELASRIITDMAKSISDDKESPIQIKIHQQKDVELSPEEREKLRRLVEQTILKPAKEQGENQ